MKTELEQKFFNTFGIEPFCDLPCNKRGVECTDNTYCGNKYPDITAEKLLEMICIVFNTFQSFEINRTYTVETLKDKILSLLILAKDDVYNQIQQLFEGEK